MGHKTSSGAAGDMWFYERQAATEGWTRVAGIDEVGRGPLAGPVVAAAVVLPPGVVTPPVRDSKQLSACRRDELERELRNLPGIAIGIGIMTAPDIDRLNILQATHEAMRRAVAQLHPPPDFVLIDGLPVRRFPLPQKAIVRGDTLSASISAASILAKVYRDRLMVELDRRYPGYAFAQHKGYGTAQHLAALKRLGPCPEHRRSFAPVAAVINPGPTQPTLSLSTEESRH